MRPLFGCARPMFAGGSTPPAHRVGGYGTPLTATIRVAVATGPRCKATADLAEAWMKKSEPSPKDGEHRAKWFAFHGHVSAPAARGCSADGPNTDDACGGSCAACRSFTTLMVIAAHTNRSPTGFMVGLLCPLSYGYVSETTGPNFPPAKGDVKCTQRGM